MSTNLRKGIGQTLDADSDGKGEQVVLAGPGKPREAHMRGRPRDCADQQTRHQTDLAHEITRQKRAAERDPEAEHFCHRRNVRVGNVQALEQGHGHCARQVPGHAEARDQQ